MGEPSDKAHDYNPLVTGRARTYRRNFRTMLAALVVSSLIMGLKFYCYWVTGSSAILSDALESIINVVAGAFATASVFLSAKPPDESHPYGHGKIEYFSAGFEGALILLAAVGIFREGVMQIVDPRSLPDLQLGLWILTGVTAVNLGLGLVLVSTGKRTRSLVLVADGKHILTDVFTSGGVSIGLGLVHLTGLVRLDGMVACLVGINIVVTGVKLVRQAAKGLMDASDPALLEEICRVLAEHRKDVWIDVHRLRAWRSGNRVHADFHLILPNELPLAEGHEEVKALERIFSEHFDGEVEVLIHLDPCSDLECPVCANDPCDLRNADVVRPRIWSRESLTADVADNRDARPAPPHDRK